MPILIEGVFNRKQLLKEIKKLGLKKADVREFFLANRSALIYLKDESLCKEIFKEFVPSEDVEREIREVHNYVEKFKFLIDMERLAELEQQEEEIKRLSGFERELLGRAVLGLKGIRLGLKFHYHIVKFLREKEIQTEITSGDIVLVSRGNPLKSDLQGTVLKVGERYITVAFDNRPPSWVYKSGVRLDLYINDVTFKRMEENLEFLRHAEGRKRYLRNVILGLKEPEDAFSVDFCPVDGRLNEFQKKAVSYALGSQDFFLIHGPFGTGKTSTLVELIVQLVKRGEKVLACADSNIAADNMLLGLSKYSSRLKVVRLGHPARVLEELESFSIFSQAQEHPEASKLREGWEKVRELIKDRDRFLKPTPALRRGMSDEEIVFFAKRGKSFRGVPAKKIKSMAEWILKNGEIDIRIKYLKELEQQILTEILRDADVVVSTNSMLKSEICDFIEFDSAVIDEGSQQVEPSTLIPIMKARRFFIAGDHKQLPPTVVSREAKELEKTLFEKLVSSHPKLARLLRIQYRMNEKIMQFPNETFYDGLLIADDSVKNRTLKSLALKSPTRFKRILDPAEPLSFVDTSLINAPELLPKGSFSFINEEEALLCVRFCSELLKMGLNPKDIGIISPYANQVKLIKEIAKTEGLSVEVNTVDGFQGREKETILISFVRSNESGELGFLKDLRRLNVAITRARSKLICIGNAKTLSSNDVYRSFLQYIKREGVFERLK